MALTAEQNEALRDIYQRLDPSKPINPRVDNALYVPLYEHLGERDPVEKLQKHIKWTSQQSVQLFSGYSGSGKTSELFRLRDRLEADGYVVLYADAVEYLNTADQIDISHLLIAIAGAFSDTYHKQFGEDPIHEQYWTRLWNWLNKTEVSLKDASIKGEASLLDGIKSGAEIKIEMRSSPSFRSQIQKSLANRIGELQENLERFIIEAIEGKPKIVFLFDSLEQFQGSVSNERDVVESVKRIFSQFLHLLQLPGVHCIFTVPSWLRFQLPNLAIRPTYLPSIRLWKNNKARTPFNDGKECLRKIVYLRLGELGRKLCLGKPNAKGHFALVERMIDVCGGDLRTLFNLLREALLQSRELPISEEDIEGAIVSMRRNFLPIRKRDAALMSEVDKTRKLVRDSDDSMWLTLLLNQHLILYLTNGEDWYDVHPIIRKEALAVAALAAPLKVE